MGTLQYRSDGLVGMADKDPRRAEARRLSLEMGWTQERIAHHLQVSTRTIERWASQDGWGARKQARKVVAIAPRKQSSPTPGDEPAPRPRRKRGEIDELEIVENAIVNLDSMLNSMAGHGMIDTRGIGGTAGALVKLLEYRRKLQPPTAAELAEQMIALGIPPAEVVSELKRLGWAQQRA